MCGRRDIGLLLTEPDVGSDPARMASTATPIDDGQAYELEGVKLWTTNGVVADLLVVMARVPRSEGHRGGISAFVVEADSPGITVERRNKFMGLRGIENGVTRLHRVRVPKDNLIGREGDGLKIALTTLNAGRLSLPAIATGVAKQALKIAREWSVERVQWGKPVGQHEAVASKISFIAATNYALDAVVELSSQMADEGRNDIRIEAALAKLWSSEMACLVGDELLQIRGGRGYETAESSPRAVSGRYQWSRWCGTCGSTGSSKGPVRSCGCSSRVKRSTRTSLPRVIWRTLRPICGEGRGGGRRQRVLREVVAEAGFRRRPTTHDVPRVRRPGDTSAFCRTLVTQIGPQHLLRDGALAGQPGEKARVPRPHRGYRRRAIRHLRGVCARRGAANGRSGRG